MDKATRDMAYKAEQPEYNENHENRPKHIVFPLGTEKSKQFEVSHEQSLLVPVAVTFVWPSVRGSAPLWTGMLRETQEGTL